MQAVQIDELELFEAWSQSDTGMRVRAGFPISSGTATKSTAVVYFELEPDEHLGSHTDSAEEILLILEGKGEATIGEEQAAVQAGTLTVVPALTPHSSARRRALHDFAAQRSSGPDSARKSIMARVSGPAFARVCARQDSNLRPLPPQGSALSPELRARGSQV